MSITFKKLFGQRLAMLRDSRNLKQHQLARLVGKKDRYISSIETGKTFPRAEMIPVLAKALGAQVSVLFSFDGTESDPKALRRMINEILDRCETSELRKFYRHLIISLE